MTFKGQIIAIIIVLALIGTGAAIVRLVRWAAPWLAALRHMGETGPIGGQPCTGPCGWPEAHRLGDDTAAMLCERCAGNPDARCTCPADCGRRYCTWATAVLDARFSAELARLLTREGGQ